MTYLKTDIDGFVRDEASRAVLNTDNKAYLAFKERRKALLEREQMKEDIADLKGSLADIKSLIEMLLREQNK